MHSTGIRGTSWVEVPLTSLSARQDSICDLEGRTAYTNVRPDLEKNREGLPARFRVFSYDIETMSTDPDGGFPQATRQGDAVIQIGVTLNHYQNKDCYRKVLLSLGDCDEHPSFEVRVFHKEAELLLGFIELLREEDPDVIVGYNIFGFDGPYLHKRAELHGISSEFSQWSRLRRDCQFREKRLSSSALGDNRMYYYESFGRIQVDLLKVVQRDHNLPSYKLDYVASHFNQNAILQLHEGHFLTGSTSGLDEEGYFSVKVIEEDSCGVEDELPEKYKVVSIEGNRVSFEGGPIRVPDTTTEMRWCMAKDDLPAKKIFEYWPKGPSHRLAVAKYCVKDCVLVNFLMEKLDVLANNMAMSNVCFIPLQWVFLRGQGVKGLSLVAEQCRRDGYLIPTIRKDDFVNIMWSGSSQERKGRVGSSDTECTYDGCGTKGRLARYAENTIVCEACWRVQYSAAYQGAVVFDPKPGIYWDPVAVLDYASLYPSSMIAKNISWETLVEDESLLHAPGYKFHRVTYKDMGIVKKEVVCHFAEREDGVKGVLPRILMGLLEERSATRKLLKQEKNPFKRAILDGHQRALKVTCNSCYGTTGALTSALYKKSLAACTTATGVCMLERARTFVENEFIPWIQQELPADHWSRTLLPFRPEVVYGDTDSVFCSWNLPTDMPAREKRAISIKLGQLASTGIKPLLDKPQDLEYEKVFHPWIVLTKKRYAGLKYEFDPDKFTFSHMGIVLKRRDSCLMVKKVCGGILHRMLTESSPARVKAYVNGMLEDIVAGKYDINCFVTSKRLKAKYKAPESLAHVMLARRMAERDPGTAPQTGDRLSYVTVYDPKHLDAAHKVLQADRVEEVGYVLEKQLPVDYLFYITNQIMVPACQFLGLIVKRPDATLFKPLIERVTRTRRREKSKAIVNKFTEYFRIKG